MPHELVPFTEDHLEPAVALFAEAYRREQVASPLLPSRALDDPGWIQAALRSHLGSPGVAAVDAGRLLGYMVTGGQFPWKGQQCALVPEYAHATRADAAGPQRQALIQGMYAHMAKDWVDHHYHIHLIGHLAHDGLLQETLYQLGFGAILAERLRDLSPVPVRDGVHVDIVEETDVSRLVEIELTHTRYYPKSPIFLRRAVDAQQVRADLEAHIAQGDILLVHYDREQPCATMIVGTSTDDGEGFLLQNTNTAQIKGAYALPLYRGQGIGAALLHHAVQWAQSRGYARLMVEHETANLFGGAFWRKHFEAYLHISMRYVDNTL